MARTRDEIVAEMLETMPETYDKTVGSPFYETQMPTAIQIESMEIQQDEILNNAFFETADDEHKEIIAKDRANIERKAAVASTGVVVITGTPGASISVGDKVASDTCVFSVTESKTLPESGTMEVGVQCDIEGVAGNVPVGAIKDFPVTLSGLNTVTNPKAIENGYDKESVEDFAARYYEKIRDPATSGNQKQYKQWAKEVEGVGDAVILPRTPSRGSVTVVIINAEKKKASDELCTKVFDYIEERRPIGADVYVESAKEVPLNIRLSITTVEEAKDYAQAIKDELAKWLKTQAFAVEYISYAKIGDHILSVPGILDYSDLFVNDVKANIPIANTSVAVMGGVTIE